LLLRTSAAGKSYAVKRDFYPTQTGNERNATDATDATTAFIIVYCVSGVRCVSGALFLRFCVRYVEWKRCLTFARVFV